MANTSLPPREFARTHGAVIDRLWDTYGLFPPHDADGVRLSLVQALSAVLKHRRAFVLPRFTAADDVWRMRECVSFALTVAVAIDHLAAYLRSRDDAYRTPLAPLWEDLAPASDHGNPGGLPAAVYHLLVPARGRQWIAREPAVAALLANYYTGDDPNDFDDVTRPILHRYLPGGRHAAADPAPDEPPTSEDDAARGGSAIRGLAARLREATTRRPDPNIRRERAIRLGAAEAAAAPARALRLTEPQHAELVGRLEDIALDLADGDATRPLDRIDADAAAAHLQRRSERRRKALAAATAEFRRSHDADRDAFLRDLDRDRREADAEVVADARALATAIRHRDPANPLDAEALAPLRDLMDRDPAHAAYCAAPGTDTTAAWLSPLILPDDRPETAPVLARLAAHAAPEELAALTPVAAAAYLEERAGVLDQAGLDRELRIVETVLVHWARTLDPAHRLARHAAAGRPEGDDAAAGNAGDGDAERAAKALADAVAPPRRAAFVAGATATLRAFAAYAATLDRRIDDATPALAAAFLESRPDGPEDAGDVLRLLLVHHARTLAPGDDLPPPYRTPDDARPAVARHPGAPDTPPDADGCASGPACGHVEPEGEDSEDGDAAAKPVVPPDVGPDAPEPGGTNPGPPDAEPADRPRDEPPPVHGPARQGTPGGGGRRRRRRGRGSSRRTRDLAPTVPEPPPAEARLADAVPPASTATHPGPALGHRRIPVVDAEPNARPADALPEQPALEPLEPWQTPPLPAPVAAPGRTRVPYAKLFPQRRAGGPPPDAAVFLFVDHLADALRTGALAANTADALLHRLPNDCWFVLTPAAYHHYRRFGPAAAPGAPARSRADSPDVDRPQPAPGNHDAPAVDQNAFARHLAAANLIAVNGRAAAEPGANHAVRHTFTARGADDATRTGIILDDAALRARAPDAPTEPSRWLYVPRLHDENDRRPVPRSYVRTPWGTSP